MFLDLIKGISNSETNNLTLIMGRSGSGKTTIAGTWPKPLLHVSIGKDGGGIVLKSYSDDEIKSIILNQDDGVSIYQKLHGLLTELSTAKHDFKTILIDPYSSVEESLIKFMETQKNKRLNQDERGDVFRRMLLMRDLIVDLSRKNINIVLCCHVKTMKMTDTQTGEEVLKIIPKMSENNGNNLLEPIPDVIYACRKTVVDQDGKNPVVKFLCYVGPHPNMDTKLRVEDKKYSKSLLVEDCSYEKINQIKRNTFAEKDVKIIENTNPFDDVESDAWK